jgi:hypothetical protein
MMHVDLLGFAGVCQSSLALKKTSKVRKVSISLGIGSKLRTTIGERRYGRQDGLRDLIALKAENLGEKKEVTEKADRNKFKKSFLFFIISPVGTFGVGFTQLIGFLGIRAVIRKKRDPLSSA